MDLLYLLYSLLRKKWIILLCTVFGVTAGFVFFMFRPKEYVSLAQYSTGFTMEQKVKIKQEDMFNIYEIDTRFNNVNVAFASDKVFGMISYKLLLHDLEDSVPFRQPKKTEKNYVLLTPANIEKAKKILRNKINDLQLLNYYSPDEKMVKDLIDLYGYGPNFLMKSLSQDRVGRTDFIEIFANSENPFLSAFMANTAGQQLIGFFNQIYGLRTTTASNKLDSLVDAKGHIVDSLTQRLKEYKDKIGPTTGEAKATAAMSVVQELIGKYQEETGRLNRLRGELTAIEEQLSSLGTGNDNTSGATTSNNNREIKRLQDRNIELDKQLAGKSEEDKKKIQDEIDANTSKIIQLSAGSKTTGGTTSDRDRRNLKRDELIARKIELQQDILAAEANVKEYKKEKDTYENMTKQDGGAEILLNELQSKVEIARKEWEGLRNSLQSKIDLELNPENNFKQTLIAVPADKPSPSRKLIISGLAGFLMFFFSSFVILLLEFLDSSYKTPTMFQRATKLKNLTSLVDIDLKHQNLETLINTPAADLKSKPQQVFLENLRKLRFELENSGKKVFLFTSTRPKEGKSMLIEALANIFSLTHKKVLIIDANFSNNTLSEKFGAGPVLEKFSVNGQPNAIDKILSATGATTIPNADIIGCGEGNYSPAEILPPHHLLESLDKVTSKYDYVFIEAASLNHHPDAKEISKYVDGIVAVISAESSQAQSDRESIEYLKSVGDKLVGAVFNKVQKENIDL